MSIIELRPRLYRLILGRYQAYLWRDDESVTLIDTGEVGSGPAIADGMRQIGLTPADLDRVVLTHSHDDHAGSAADIRSWGDVRIVAHESDAPVVRGEAPGSPPNFTEFERQLHAQVAAGLPPAPPVHVDHEVRDGDILDFGGGAHVISTPGHTDGSIAVYLPEHRLIFTGDIAAEYEGNVILGVFNLDRTAAAASFVQLARLDVDIACFGHGEPVLGNATARLQQVADTLNVASSR
jgi:glyoxylase-like metal-dependent hydrolase (beta-lactamase superfamily II)